jgi:hypothetical protein
VTQPLVLVRAAPQQQLRIVEHPSLSPVLTHFCARGRPPGPGVPPSISAMTGQQKLEQILWERRLLAFVTFSGGDPAACFSEATPDAIQFLLRNRGYEPWGLMFSRQSVYDAGGAPVWYARPAEIDVLRMLASRGELDIRAWAVRLDPGSDWLEEREWRIPRPHSASSSPGIDVSELHLVGLLVGDHAWTGARYTQAITASGRLEHGLFYPPIQPGVPRWWWNTASSTLVPLPPLY